MFLVRKRAYNSGCAFFCINRTIYIKKNKKSC
nr:MAG TPA: hypothetical protein [Caudoviricetes sp.]